MVWTFARTDKRFPVKAGEEGAARQSEPQQSDLGPQVVAAALLDRRIASGEIGVIELVLHGSILQRMRPCVRGSVIVGRTGYADELTSLRVYPVLRVRTRCGSANAACEETASTTVPAISVTNAVAQNGEG